MPWLAAARRSRSLKSSIPDNMELNKSKTLREQAIKVLENASSAFGISASADDMENYGHIWARDSAVAGLAIFAAELEDLYPVVEKSYRLLQKAAGENGQIPSNIKLDETGEIATVSFGGVAGRTDASFWWIIGSIHLLNQITNEDFKAQVEEQCKAIFKLADAWEFNGKKLMYVPMSSNWADEYITHGYVLYDQLLRYWALYLAAVYFKNESWRIKAEAVKSAIKQHFLMEIATEGSLFTFAQRKEMSDFDLSKDFLASFSPGDRVEKFDAWSIALLLMLGIPSNGSILKIEEALKKIFSQTGNKGIPAFWPLIEEGNLFDALQRNHSYRFKNIPGHFHNGGIWPVVNGFLVAGLGIAGLTKTAEMIKSAMEDRLLTHKEEKPFSEYYDYYLGKPGGVQNLCFSASGFLLADSALAPNGIKSRIILPTPLTENLRAAVHRNFKSIINSVNLRQPVAISIAGESGCGKTTLSCLLKELLDLHEIKNVILHQDDYFKLPPKQNHNAREVDFNHIGPKEVRLDLLDHHLSIIKSGGTSFLTIPVMNWEKDVEEVVDIDIRGVQVVIVEGTYTTLLKNTDYKFFINTSYLETRNNRINRNREEVTEFIERVLCKESNIIQSHKQAADVILNNRFEVIN